ncbi:MAG: hypothetical protein H7Y42_12355 [Chitinophagaceae bacterium]|nr:hypothetical protein [Chitinophagaceae bacterium]
MNITQDEKKTVPNWPKPGEPGKKSAPGYYPPDVKPTNPAPSQPAQTPAPAPSNPSKPKQ